MFVWLVCGLLCDVAWCVCLSVCGVCLPMVLYILFVNDCVMLYGVLLLFGCCLWLCFCMWMFVMCVCV